LIGLAKVTADEIENPNTLAIEIERIGSLTNPVIEEPV
jgi:hypothetical protein